MRAAKTCRFLRLRGDLFRVLLLRFLERVFVLRNGFAKLNSFSVQHCVLLVFKLVQYLLTSLRLFHKVRLRCLVPLRRIAAFFTHFGKYSFAFSREVVVRRLPRIDLFLYRLGKLLVLIRLFAKLTGDAVCVNLGTLCVNLGSALDRPRQFTLGPTQCLGGTLLLGSNIAGTLYFFGFVQATGQRINLIALGFHIGQQRFILDDLFVVATTCVTFLYSRGSIVINNRFELVKFFVQRLRFFVDGLLGVAQLACNRVLDTRNLIHHALELLFINRTFYFFARQVKTVLQHSDQTLALFRRIFTLLFLAQFLLVLQQFQHVFWFASISSASVENVTFTEKRRGRGYALNPTL